MNITSAIRRCIFRLKLKQIKVKLQKRSYIEANDTFEGQNYIGEKTVVLYSDIGKMTYISNNSFIEYAKIGRYSSIGPDVSIVSGEHPTKKYVSTCPSFYSQFSANGKSYVNTNKFDEFRYVDYNKKYKVIIGNDVWIGAKAQIIEGVIIGDGAIVGAGAVVVKNVPPYAIIGGVPAKVIGYRFDEKQIEWLEKLKWWNKEEDWIEQYAEKFEDIDDFIKTINVEIEKNNGFEAF